MLTRAFHGRKSSTNKRPAETGECSSNSGNRATPRPLKYHEDEECIVGLTGDLPLNMCDGGLSTKTRVKGGLCLREVMMGSVQMMGESWLGISEKVVLMDGMAYAAKRFKKVSVTGKEFSKRVDRIARISKGSEHLLQVRAYLYAKRIKIILSDYHPMGSLADLLKGAREHSHTALDWNQRLKIVIQVAKAISYIHGQSPSLHEKNFQANVHGNIKASNVVIRTNFSACLSEYGYAQLADPIEGVSVETINYTEKMSQKSDICSFGLMVLDLLGGPEAIPLIHCIIEKKAEIKEGKAEFFEFIVRGIERKQAMEVLDIALACTSKPLEDRPSIENILLYLDNICVHVSSFLSK